MSDPLADPVRLAMLRSTGLLGTPHEAAFDRLAGLARKVLKAPVGMVSLLDDRHLHVKSCVGLPELAKAGRVPVTESFCQHVVITEQALVVEDAREHELTRDLAIVKSGMALAYAGVPLVLPGGFVVGTLSVADSEPRAWAPEEVDILRDLAASVLTEIELRADIEARKQAESDLQRSTDRLRGLMDNSPTIIFAKDLEGRYLFLNHAGERMLGLPESEAIGKTDADLHPAEVAARLQETDQAVIAGGEPVEIEESADLDGRPVVYRSVKFPLTDQAGEPYGVCGISTDITERKHTERALREVQQRFVSAFEHAPTGMAMVGTDGGFTQVNQALCELTGRSEADLLRMALPDTIHPEEWAARKRLFERMLTGEIRTHQTQGRILTGDGEPRWVLVNATALTDAEGWPTEFFVQFQDITEQTRGQQLLAARHDVTRVLAQSASVEHAAPQLLEALGANLGWQVGTLWLAEDDVLAPANAVNRTVAAEMLPKRGYRVEVACDGAEALEATARERFAVVLMDLHMPTMDGYEASRAIREREGDGPRRAIVAMTSDTLDSVREACFAAGMDDHLAKPVTGEALAKTVERWRGDDAPPVDDAAEPKAGEATDLDLGVLRRLTAGTGGEANSQLIRDLAGLFQEDSRRGLKQVADALRQKDAQGVARAAYALKGSSGQLGAARTQAISAELQAVAESGELGSAKALLRRLETAVDAAQSALTTALPETPAE